MKYNFFIIGLGQIGGSLALALRKGKLAGRIYGKDKQFKESYSQILDEYLDNVELGVKKSEIIVLATPVREIKKLIREIGPVLEKEKILVDTGSTKIEVIKEMQRYSEKILIGGHPMSGTVKSGEKAWRADLFSGKPFFLCFPHRFSKRGKPIIERIIKNIGAIPLEIDPVHHDFCAAATSHLPYVISLVLFSSYLSNQSRDRRLDQFISSGFLGATRLALTPAEVGTDIIMTNKNNITKNVKKLICELEKFLVKIKNEEVFEFIENINQEAEKRRKTYENAFF